MKDRRVRKTEEAIKFAFSELLSKKDFKDITIKELCEVADINKSTFYLHYRDIYDCADKLVINIVEKTIEIITQYNFTDLVNHLPEIIEKTTQIFEDNRDFYIPFLRSASHAPTLYKIKQLMIEKILEQTTDYQPQNTTTKCIISFIVCGILGVFEQNEFDKITPEITTILIDKIQHGFISN